MILAKSVVDVKSHPLRYISQFLAKLFFLNKEITEKHLGEETWYFEDDKKIKLDDLKTLFESMEIGKYHSNLAEVYIQLFSEIIKTEK